MGRRTYTVQQEDEIVARLKTGETYVDIAADYAGVSKSTVFNIAKKHGLTRNASKADQQNLREELRLLAEQHRPLTVRQAFYRAVSAGLVDKTEQAYRKVIKMTKEMRESGDLDWDAIADSTRFTYGGARYQNHQQMVARWARAYRQDLMANQNVTIQVWAESDSIGSLIAPYAENYGISTFIGRGYGSKGFYWNAARDLYLALVAKKTFVMLHIGDFDPSGADIVRDVQEHLADYALSMVLDDSVKAARRAVSGAKYGDWLFEDFTWSSGETVGPEPEFVRVAVRPEHIAQFNLPTRPPKEKDSRSANFGSDQTVEVEAMTTPDIRNLLTSHIESYIDAVQLNIAKQAEKSEREILANIAKAGAR